MSQAQHHERAQHHEKVHRHEQALRRELGPEVLAALADDDVVEVMLNADGRLWLERRSCGLVEAGVSLSIERARSLVATVAGLLGRVVGERSPILEAELPLDGSRFEALVPPVVERPVFAIRKRATRVIPLDRYVADGIVSPAQARQLRDAVARRLNIVVSGGPGSGKTTFVNALLGLMGGPESAGSRGERLVILEDTYELRCDAPNHVVLHTSEAVDLRALVRATLRLRPDRIVVGEVRGAEAHELLKAWNTGNPGGCATVHANSAIDALARLDQLAQEAGVPSQASLVARAVHRVAHIERTTSGRRLRELVAVRGDHPERGFEVEALHTNGSEGSEE